MKPNSKLNFHQSKHLVERTGFGAELDIIQSFVGRDLNSCVDSLLIPINSQIKPPQILKASEREQKVKQFKKDGERPKVGELYRKERSLLQDWGIEYLLGKVNPLHERMVWFWHNHFTSSIDKVRTASWIHQQDLLIRTEALGDFSTLLKQMTFDPAMLIYLDGRSNRKSQPNENYARELLELFTLGEGNYTEKDIKEAARAFTGWGVSAKENNSVFKKKQHDLGTKEFMGEKGNFTATDILDILLKKARTAEFIAEKLWFEFVSIQTPEANTIKSWASIFRDSGYDISTLLEAIFKSDAFWDEKYRGTLIKSPIELVIGTLRTLDLEDKDIGTPNKDYFAQMKKMGQELYAPPNVKGWEGGQTWINDDSLLHRQRFLRRILRGQVGVNKNKLMKADSQSMQDMSSNMSSMESASTKNNKQQTLSYELPDLSEEQWIDWLLPIPAVLPINKENKQTRLASILLDPAYQLK